jgi:hypothetical protein
MKIPFFRKSDKKKKIKERELVGSTSFAVIAATAIRWGTRPL